MDETSHLLAIISGGLFGLVVAFAITKLFLNEKEVDHIMREMYKKNRESNQPTKGSQWPKK